MPRRSRCNYNAEHSGRGTCSRSLLGAREGFEPVTIRTKGAQPYHWATMPMPHYLNIIISCVSRKKKRNIHLTWRSMQENAEEVCLPPREKVQNRSLSTHQTISPSSINE